MVETLALVAFGLAFPTLLGSLEQRQRADHVCMRKGERVFYRAVNMALGGKVDYAVDAVFRHKALHCPVVANVGLDEHVVLLALYVLEVGKVARIRQLVHVDDAVLGVLVHEQAHHVRADEARPARYHYVTLEIHCLSLFFGK